MKLPENGKTVVRTDIMCGNCFWDLNIQKPKFMLVTFGENEVSEVCPVCRNGYQYKREEYLDSNPGFTFIYRRLPFDGNLGPIKSKISKEQLEEEFAIRQSLQQIGDKYGLSRERVRQLGVKYDLKKPSMHTGKIYAKCSCGLELESKRLKNGKCFICRTHVWLVCETCKNVFPKRMSDYRGALGITRKKKRILNVFFCNKKCYGVYWGKHHGFGVHPEHTDREKRKQSLSAQNNKEITRVRIKFF